MSKVINFFKQYYLVLVVILISVPAFYKMLPYGIYSMQDFHLFRLFEFNKCVEALQIPCRWSPDAGLGYGEPLFNFYGQGTYLIGQIFHLLGASFIDSTKMLFILSLAGSALAMFLLSKTIWKNNWSAILSTVIYLYAPYRAVDVWVRGALPEAMAFVLFPLLILSVEKKNMFYFSLLTFLLIITHNLSFIMFLPFLVAWIIYKKWWKSLYGFIIAGLMSAFYILPVIFESKFVSLESTTTGYFDFRAHFVTLKQIFIDTKWAYGGSTWGDGDNVNLSVGLLQWIIPAFVLVLTFLKGKILESKKFLIMFGFGFLYLLLTHNKTAFVWEAIPFMKYIQFPWRFLGVSVFCLSLASGGLFNYLKGKILTFIIFALVISHTFIFTINYFSPDIWYSVSDEYFLTGEEWNRQRSASISDFWPKFGHNIPDVPSDGKYINYFPGWESSRPLEGGLIPSEGSKFKDTPIRILGNALSLIGIVILIWKRKLT